MSLMGCKHKHVFKIGNMLLRQSWFNLQIKAVVCASTKPKYDRKPATLNTNADDKDKNIKKGFNTGFQSKMESTKFREVYIDKRIDQKIKPTRYDRKFTPPNSNGKLKRLKFREYYIDKRIEQQTKPSRYKRKFVTHNSNDKLKSTKFREVYIDKRIEQNTKMSGYNRNLATYNTNEKLKSKHKDKKMKSLNFQEVYIDKRIEQITKFSQKITLPDKSYTKHLLGYKGENVKRIEKESKSNISIEKFTESDEDELCVCVQTKDADQLQKACDVVNEEIKWIIERISLEGGHGMYKEKVFIPQKDHIKVKFTKYILGEKGHKLRQIEQKTHTSIKIEDKNVLPYFLVIANDAECVANAVKELNLQMESAIESTYVEDSNIDSFSQKIDVPENKYPNINFSSLIHGMRGRNIIKLKSETKTDIQYKNHMFGPYILVKGFSEAAVQKAVMKINDQIQEAIETLNPDASWVTDKVYIPQQDYPEISFNEQLLGVKGRNIKEIENSTNASLWIVKGTSHEEPHVLVTAKDSESAQKAIRVVNNKIQSILGLKNLKTNCVTARVKIPEVLDLKIRPYLLGKNGENITNLQNETMTDIDIQVIDGQEYCIVKGSISHNVKTATDYLRSQIDGFIETRNTSLPNMCSERVVIPTKQYPGIQFRENIINGIGGTDIVQLQLETGSTIQFESKHILVTAKNSDRLNFAVFKLLERLNELIERHKKDPSFVEIVAIPTEKYPNVNFAGHIIGRNGTNMQRIELETNTKIQLTDDTDSPSVIISGKHEDLVKVAANDINTIITKLIERLKYKLN